jgi:Cys-rich protein (TIGR01571 family)
MSRGGAAFDDSYPLWHTSLFGCLQDPHSCLDVIVCPWCQLGRQYDASIGEWDSCNLVVCGLSCVLWPVSWVVPIIVRHRIVVRYQINEPIVCRALLPLVCWWCSMCQTYRELNERGLWPGGTLCVPRPAHMHGAPPAEYGVAMGDRRSGYGSL